MLTTNNPKVLYISYDGMTDDLGQSQVIPYLIGLARKGFLITILSCEKNENFSQKKDLIQKKLFSENIVWETVKYTKKPPVLSTIKDLFLLNIKAKKLHKNNNFNIVHCRSYVSSLIGLRLKKNVGVRFIFDMRGFWADERIDGKLWNISNPIFKMIFDFFKKKEREYLNRADYTVSLTHRGKDEIYSWSGLDKEKIPIQVIPCCVDTDLFSPEKITKQKKDKLVRDLGIKEGHFTLLYLGGIGTWYMLEEMLDFFKRLKSENENAKFLFVTSENPDKIYSNALKKDLRKEDIIVRKADRNAVPTYISISTASIFFIKPAYSKKASSPTKQGELMSMGIPVICNSGVGDTDLIIERYNSGVLVKEFSKEEYDRIIKDINQLLALDKKQIRQGAEDYFSLEKGIQSYEKIYNQVLR